MNKKGFTLVELLAIIVVISIILAITIPKISDVIKERKQDALVLSAKAIVREVEYNYLDSGTVGIYALSELDIEDATSDKFDLTNSKVQIYKDGIYVDLKGAGKYAGLYAAASSTSKGVIQGNQSSLATTVIATSGNMLEDPTEDHNLRYSGPTPNNYVKFNGTNNKWRIIGIFDVKSSLTGKSEKRIKLIGPSIGAYSWDSSDSTVNSGNGVNDWVNADLNNVLNNLYYNGTSGTCYNGGSNASASCNFSSNTLNASAKSMIDDAVWYLGAPTWVPNVSPYPAPTLTFYQAERGTTVSVSGRPTTHTARIGLIYPSDYGYASTDADCRRDMRSGLESGGTARCQVANNWLAYPSYWTISPRRSDGFGALYVLNSDSVFVSSFGAGSALSTRPVVYLKADVKIISGNGTSGANAYELSL